MGLMALAVVSCLGGLRRDPAVQAVSTAPRGALALPVREDRAYWLLRGEPGWAAAHETRFGGDPGDGARCVVRAVRFRDEEAAIQAYARLTPAYLLKTYRDRMAREPSPRAYPVLLEGDQVAVAEFVVRFAGSENAEDPLLGQVTAIREGSIVILIESIGVEQERFVPAVSDAVRAAGQVASLEQ